MPPTIRPARSTSATCRSGGPANPPRSGARASSCARGEADYINGTTIEIDGGMLPGVLYDAGFKTITDLL